MRWTHAHIPTLRDDPTGAEAVSHRLLVRAGFIRPLAAGHYSLLPLGQRVRRKVMRIIRDEQDRIGAQEVHLPTMHPAEVWRESGRDELMGDIMFRLVDRRGIDHVLGVTEEELFAINAAEITSYRQLPQMWYQIHTKFRDEPRPRSGLLRVREFTMKDAYSLDVDVDGLATSFERQRGAYERTFERLRLDALDVVASSGAMGGSESVEFVVASDVGEDLILVCEQCDYRANRERAQARVPAVDDEAAAADEVERLSTPGIRTIAELVEAHPDVAAPERQLKTLVYVVDDVVTLAVVRGDHDLQEQKLLDAAAASDARPATPEEALAALGALPGSLGAVGVTDHPVLVDEALVGRRGMVTGANEDDWHVTGVDVDRDLLGHGTVADLRAVEAGEPCIECGSPLVMWQGIEVGHIFKLGTKFSEAFGAMVQTEDGDTVPIVMGSYGIGVSRLVGGIIEAHHDDAGIVWPVAVAPYEVVITALRADDEDVTAAGDRLYTELADAGLDVLFDDRVERTGVKFADAELIGVPWRITLGPRGLKDGQVELTERATMETTDVALDDVVAIVAERVRAAR